MISPALAAALERGRDRLNARWTVRRPRGEPADFLDVVASNLDGVATAVAAATAADAAAPPDIVDRVCEALYDAALDLWSHGRLGTAPHADPMAALFQHVFPVIPHALAAEPAETVGAFTHAVLELRREGCTETAGWVDDLAALGTLTTDLGALRAAGVVMAWRRGLAHARDTALAQFPVLPAPVVAGVAVRMGLMERSVDDVVARLSRRWHLSPATDVGRPRLAVVGYAGSFEAFGGPFARPPQVGNAGGRIVASDGVGAWTVHADDFGSVLRPTLQAPRVSSSTSSSKTETHVGADGAIVWRGLRTIFPILERATSWAEDGDTLAVACADSHRLRLVTVHGVTP